MYEQVTPHFLYFNMNFWWKRSKEKIFYYSTILRTLTTSDGLFMRLSASVKINIQINTFSRRLQEFFQDSNVDYSF